MSKFKFRGHIRPFWSTDVVGRICITVTRTDLGNKHARSDIFYADDTTVSQVAAAVQQALFGPADEDPCSDKEQVGPDKVCLTVRGEGTYVFNPTLSFKDLPFLRGIVGQLEWQEQRNEAFREAYGGKDKSCECEVKAAEPSLDDRVRQLETRVKYLGNCIKDGHFEPLCSIPFDKEVWVRQASTEAGCSGNVGPGTMRFNDTEQDRRDRAQANASSATACARNVAAEDWPEEGGVEDPNRKG